jgi:acetyl-CoA carboxylase carboxyl transferase subunit beta
MRINARKRLDHLLDPKPRTEIGDTVFPVDALKFRDSKKYPDRLKQANDVSGESEALVVIAGKIESIPAVVACFEFEYMGGSMGSVVGERFVRGVQEAINNKFDVDQALASRSTLHQCIDGSHHGRYLCELCLHG